jgi:hypothetical protein
MGVGKVGPPPGAAILSHRMTTCKSTAEETAALTAATAPTVQVVIARGSVLAVTKARVASSAYTM